MPGRSWSATDCSLPQHPFFSALILPLPIAHACSLFVPTTFPTVRLPDTAVTHWWWFFFKRFYLFIFSFLGKGRGRDKERERNINVWFLLTHLYLGTRPTTQACALTGNQSSIPLVHRPALNPLSHTSQGLWCVFNVVCCYLPRAFSI